MTIFGVGECKNVENYLGLPTHIEWKKKEAFSYIKERLTKVTKTWYAKSLSRVGKEAMIKAVGQTIPCYITGVFHISKIMCKKRWR